MSGEPNTVNNSENKTDDAANAATTVDLTTEEAKAAINAKVEEVVGSRVAREKSKTEAAEAKAKTEEDARIAAEKTIATLTSEKTAAEEAREAALKDVTVLKLSIEEGVTPEMVKSLKGETYDDLKAAIAAVRGSVKPSVNRIFDGKDTTKPKGSSDLSEAILKAAKAQRNR